MDSLMQNISGRHCDKSIQFMPTSKPLKDGCYQSLGGESCLERCSPVSWSFVNQFFFPFIWD